jgi:DNA-binding phage protein
MALTRDFRETVWASAQRDRTFREALLSEALDALLAGDVATGKAILRDYVNATIGFEALAVKTGTPAKSLHRMLGRSGNPRLAHFTAIVAALSEYEGVALDVTASRAA